MAGIFKQMARAMCLCVWLVACGDPAIDTSSVESYRDTFFYAVGADGHDADQAIGLIVAARDGLEKPANLSDTEFRNALKALPQDGQARQDALADLSVSAAHYRLIAETGDPNVEFGEAGLRLIPEVLNGMTKADLITAGKKAYPKVEAMVPRLLIPLNAALAEDVKGYLAASEKNLAEERARLAEAEAMLAESQALIPKIEFHCCRVKTNPADGDPSIILKLTNGTERLIASIEFFFYNGVEKTLVTHEFKPPVRPGATYEEPVDGVIFHTMGAKEFANIRKEVSFITLTDGHKVISILEAKNYVDRAKEAIARTEAHIAARETELEEIDLPKSPLQP